MAKGQIVKAKLIEVLQEVFPNMFSPDGKEWRIPLIENGENIEIKVALTCAAKNIGGEGIPVVAGKTDSPLTVEQLVVTEEEKQAILELMKRLEL